MAPVLKVGSCSAGVAGVASIPSDGEAMGGYPRKHMRMGWIGILIRTSFREMKNSKGSIVAFGRVLKKINVIDE